MAHKLDNLYRGVPIFIISTGTSLRGFDFSRLNGKLTIGMNRIIEYYHPSIMHFVDITATTTHAEALRNYNGMIIGGPGAVPKDTHANTFEISRNIDTFELVGNMKTTTKYVGRSFSEGWFGGGAGCTALHAAILLGGNPIYLLGYDYYQENGGHFDEYDESRNDQNLYVDSYVSIEHLGRQDWLPKIYNCNPRSRVTCFPHIDINTVLEPRTSNQKTTSLVSNVRLRTPTQLSEVAKG
jgi:hypothetical protein